MPENVTNALESVKGKESWSCFGIAGLLATLLDNLQGEQFLQVLVGICFLCALGTVARLVSKFKGE